MILKEKKCQTCKAQGICKDEVVGWIFVSIGILATISIRLVTILMKFSVFWAEVSWYVGVVGFVLFFVYKYKVFKQRANFIDSHHLIDKLDQGKPFDKEDREQMAIILCKIRSNQERLNFLIIFIASFIALVLAIYFDFFA